MRNSDASDASRFRTAMIHQGSTNSINVIPSYSSKHSFLFISTQRFCWLYSCFAKSQMSAYRLVGKCLNNHQFCCFLQRQCLVVMATSFEPQNHPNKIRPKWVHHHLFGQIAANQKSYTTQKICSKHHLEHPGNILETRLEHPGGCYTLEPTAKV